MAVRYLYLVDDISRQHDTPPSKEEIQSIIDGELLVFRFDTDTMRFEQLEPIDENDGDSWSDVPFTAG